MEDEIKRWTARREAALVLEVIQRKTTVAEASRAHDLPPSEIEVWVEDGKRGMENALRANPQDVREQYEKQLKDLQEAYGEAMLELRARTGTPSRSASCVGGSECRAGQFITDRHVRRRRCRSDSAGRSNR